MAITKNSIVLSAKSLQDISKQLNHTCEEVQKLLIYQLSYIGEAAVKKARETTSDMGGYNDVTGNLRSSISYCIFVDGNPIVNGAIQRYGGAEGDGSKGVTASQELLKKLSSRFNKGIVLIVCAGMHYAAYVEHIHHKVVLSNAQLLAEKLAYQLIKTISKGSK